MMKILRLVTFFLCIAVPCFLQGEFDPIAVYLTWQRSPESTMTIHWISPADRKEDIIEYHKVGEEEWKKSQGTHRPLPEGLDNYLVHVVELTNLEANAEYRFCFGKESREFQFRTMPKQFDAAIRFVVGGDMYHDKLKLVEDMNHIAAKWNPMFALVGGDICYAADRYGTQPEDGQRWLEWLKTWKDLMVTTEGNSIPLLPVIGNHDVKGRYGQNPDCAQFFYALFATPGNQGYCALDFGDYLTVFLLDSGHTHPIEGEQTSWLSQELQTRQEIPHKFALYHVPAYPCVKNFHGKVSPNIRKYWVPLFEKFGLNVAFENHDHAYKRTHPLLDQQIDPRGVVYLGDGAWGVKLARSPRTPEQVWYLEKTASKRHFLVVTLDQEKRKFEAVDDQGEVFDELKQRR